MRKLRYFLLVGMLALAGCATLGGGQILPGTGNGTIPGVLYNDFGVLQTQATQACNVGAAEQYRMGLKICANSAAYLASVPGNPFVTPAQEGQIIDLQCTRDGYTPGMSPAVVVGGCPTIVAPK